MKKKDRIDFFKYLVCPEDIRANEDLFEEWIKNYIHKDESQDIIEYRSFLILEYYELFKKTYSYIMNSELCEEMSDVRIDFSEDEIKLSIKFDSYKTDTSLLDEVERYFSALEDDGYDLTSVEDSSKHNKVTLSFSR